MVAPATPRRVTTAPAGAPPAEERLRALIRDRPLAVSAAAAVALAALALALYTPRYETNDDVTMNLIAAGLALADRPDEHLLHTNVVIGLPLRELYGAAPAVPWYGLYQFAALTGAAAAIAYALLRVNPSPGQAAVVLLFFGVAVLPGLAEIQFTKTAFFASVAGLALFLAPLRGAAPWPRAADAAAGILVVLGSLIRFQGFLLAGVAVAPVAVLAAGAAPARAARRAIPVAAAAAAAVALYWFNLAYYARDPEWRDFYAYNALRAEFTDYQRYPYTDATRPAFKAAGWEEVDWWMMQNWFYADRERYGLDRLRQIAATVPPAPRSHFLFETARNMTRSLSNYPELVRLFLAGLCLAPLTGGGWRRFVLPAVLLGTAYAVMVVLNTYYQWLPVRVAFPYFSGVLAAAALRPGSDAVPRPGYARSPLARVRLAAAGALAAALALWTCGALADADSARTEKHREAARMLRELKPRTDRLYVVWREWFPFEALVSPLEAPVSLRPFHCVSLSALLPTPFTGRRLEEYHVTDLYRAICERPDVPLVAYPELVERNFVPYVQQHYSFSPALVATFSHPGNPPVCVVQPARFYPRGRPLNAPWGR